MTENNRSIDLDKGLEHALNKATEPKNETNLSKLSKSLFRILVKGALGNIPLFGSYLSAGAEEVFSKRLEGIDTRDTAIEHISVEIYSLSTRHEKLEDRVDILETDYIRVKKQVERVAKEIEQVRQDKGIHLDEEFNQILDYVRLCKQNEQFYGGNIFAYVDILQKRFEDILHKFKETIESNKELKEEVVALDDIVKELEKKHSETKQNVQTDDVIDYDPEANSEPEIKEKPQKITPNVIVFPKEPPNQRNTSPKLIERTADGWIFRNLKNGDLELRAELLNKGDSQTQEWWLNDYPKISEGRQAWRLPTIEEIVGEIGYRLLSLREDPTHASIVNEILDGGNNKPGLRENIKQGIIFADRIRYQQHSPYATITNPYGKDEMTKIPIHKECYLVLAPKQTGNIKRTQTTPDTETWLQALVGDNWKQLPQILQLLVPKHDYKGQKDPQIIPPIFIWTPDLQSRSEDINWAVALRVGPTSFIPDETKLFQKLFKERERAGVDLDLDANIIDLVDYLSLDTHVIQFDSKSALGVRYVGDFKDKKILQKIPPEKDTMMLFTSTQEPLEKRVNTESNKSNKKESASPAEEARNKKAKKFVTDYIKEIQGNLTDVHTYVARLNQNIIIVQKYANALEKIVNSSPDESPMKLDAKKYLIDFRAHESPTTYGSIAYFANTLHNQIYLKFAGKLKEIQKLENDYINDPSKKTEMQSLVDEVTNLAATAEKMILESQDALKSYLEMYDYFSKSESMKEITRRFGKIN